MHPSGTRGYQYRGLQGATRASLDITFSEAWGLPFPVYSDSGDRAAVVADGQPPIPLAQLLGSRVWRAQAAVSIIPNKPLPWGGGFLSSVSEGLVLYGDLGLVEVPRSHWVLELEWL